MTSKITPVRAMLFTKFSVALMCAWPLSPEATRSRVVLFRVWWYTCYISTILLLLPLLNSVYEDRDDPEILAKSVCLSAAVVQVTIKMTVCRARYTRLQAVTIFQALYHEMETFFKQADDKTNVTLQRYVNDHKRVYGVYTLWCYLTTIGVICGPLFLAESFPTNARYPFTVEQTAVRIIVYLHQSFVGLQASSAMCVDVNIAFLLLYSAARLELLAQRIRVVTNERELDACIELHDKILRYTTEMTSAIRPLVFTTITTTTMGVVFASLNIVTDQPSIIKVQYAVVAFSASIELFMCAWPADNLMRTSIKICLAAYESRWFEGGVRVRRKILQIIFRSQRPEVIRISGVLPALSLRYYAGYLYTASSYFAAVRMMVNENTEE